MMTAQETAKAHIDILQAFLDGKSIESRKKAPAYEWESSDVPIWDFYGKYYRVKPEPRTFWANVYNQGALGYLHPTKEQAEVAMNSNGETIKVAEVIE